MTQMAPVKRGDVQRASLELERMRRSLRSWLTYRMRNDSVMAGRAPAKDPSVIARIDRTAEQPLADRLHALLSEVMPDARLPNSDLRVNPGAAVELANIAITGAAPAAGPVATGNIPWWPVLIVGGLLLAVTTAVKSYADLAAERERYACIKAGACTDYGFWLKLGGIAVVGWFLWEKVGVGERVKALVRGR